MKIALITTMKSPDAPVPSGDRTFARLIRQALCHGGHTVVLPTTFSTWCRQPEGFARVKEAAEEEVERVVTALLREGAPDAVLTYHNYHKGPDLIGPVLARSFDCPYAIVEASRAPKRANGPWAAGFAAADVALRAAHAVGAVTGQDMPELASFVPDAVMTVPPFIDVRPFAANRAGDGAHIACAVMMRGGRKADSVRVLSRAFALARETMPELEITIAGDGPERAVLEPLFPSGSFAGLLDQEALARLFGKADLFVWPAIDEPFGFVFLEAQAAGLPVVGGAARGVVDVVRNGETGLLVEPTDPTALAGAMLALMRDEGRRHAMGEAARAFMRDRDLDAGARRLDALLAHAAARHARAKAAREGWEQP